ncbi:fumarylacetoacetate hydrolase family protein [Edaphobacter paludis]|uniref:Fumarylacetoacetate hydrolase family protein n=2 Tax=Edaphobacter paludis TaxID=3035702 RepID=A0AAU7D321_9BACT
MINGAQERQMMNAADMLLDARRTNRPLVELPADVRPQTVEEAYLVQDKMSWAYEAIGGWKVGAPTGDAEPMFAPMPAAWISCSGCEMRGRTHRYRGIEAEIAFLMGEDLPPRNTPYSRDEVLDAIASCHPAIEVLETAFIDPMQVARLSMIADLQLHGGFVYGPACPDWQRIDFSQEHVTLAVDGAVRVERTGSNTSGDLLRLLPFLANEGAARTGGLKRGDWITTGSWTGCTVASPGSAVDVQFSTVGKVNLRFGVEGSALPD